MLTSRDIAKMLDHSTLQPFLTEKDIRHGCEVAIKYGTATVCARPQDMEIVVPMLKGTGVLPCTVIGFPHGAHTPWKSRPWKPPAHWRTAAASWIW